jgi:hypothetical protein
MVNHQVHHQKFWIGLWNWYGVKVFRYGLIKY